MLQAELRRVTAALQAETLKRQKLEKEKKQLIHQLCERRKELTALHNAARLLQDQQKTTKEVLQELVEMLPAAWQYPEITAACLVFAGKAYATSNFAQSPWRQKGEFTITDETQGAIEIVYLEERPLIGESPFLAEERHLLNSLTEMVRSYCERQRVTDHLRTLNAELEQRVQERTAELQRSNDALQHFASVVSHDLQEPLRMVTNYTQLLATRCQGKLDAEVDEFIAYAVDGATRMQRLICDLLAYARAGMQGGKLTEVDCETVLQQTLCDLQIAIMENEAAVSHDPLPIVRGNAVQLGQVFQNLIGNALKFHGATPPRVHISAWREGAQWVLSVRDNGIGLDPQHSARIFQVFQRLHTHDEYPGTGIGLAICQKIMEYHGGRIWVESEPGKGATFCFTLSAVECSVMFGGGPLRAFDP